MALQSSGTIAMGQIRTELKQTGAISLGSAECRKLAGKPSGAIKMSDFYGKSNTVKYDNHIIYNSILSSATINLPNTVVNGSIKVVVNFQGEFISESKGTSYKNGEVIVNGNLISGLETVTKNYTLTKGSKSLTASVKNYARVQYGTDRVRTYKPRVTIYFTGEVEA